MNPVEHAINKYCLPDFKEELLIEVTNLGDLAKIVGVNAFMANRLFNMINLLNSKISRRDFTIASSLLLFGNKSLASAKDFPIVRSTKEISKAQ